MTEEEENIHDSLIGSAIMAMMPDVPDRDLAILCSAYAKACAVYGVDDKVAIKGLRAALRNFRPLADEYHRITRGAAN